MDEDRLEAFLAGLDPAIREVVEAARGLARSVVPGATETFDGNLLGFGYGAGYKGLVATIIPARGWVTFGIADAAGLPDPDGLLEGTGKRHRHVKLRTPADAGRPALRTLLEQAAAAKRPG
jgi:hypothetical protein